ncbi:hypothetical protein G6L28_04485 [Agrobacterium larrymoorei]|uniref:hypothetical protein n=1 Tax=Agrobacterium larrymoorei TaxID=160699 RepID=UPI001574245F|nr:hypothetical protein [Agrobacterium larrymoorei]NTJ41858.1 hypothetical protein [Agrobacterium larrymoorei]
MAVESISSSLGNVGLDAVDADKKASSLSKDASGKISPEMESEIIDSFLPGMITNQLMLNGQLFDFAKEAINEADSE